MSSPVWLININIISGVVVRNATAMTGLRRRRVKVPTDSQQHWGPFLLQACFWRPLCSRGDAAVARAELQETRLAAEREWLNERGNMSQEVTKIRFWVISDPFYILGCWPRVRRRASLRYEGNVAALGRAAFSQVSVGAALRSLRRSGGCRGLRSLGAALVPAKAQDGSNGARHLLGKAKSRSSAPKWRLWLEHVKESRYLAVLDL